MFDCVSVIWNCHRCTLLWHCSAACCLVIRYGIQHLVASSSNFSLWSRCYSRFEVLLRSEATSRFDLLTCLVKVLMFLLTWRDRAKRMWSEKLVIKKNKPKIFPHGPKLLATCSTKGVAVVKVRNWPKQLTPVLLKCIPNRRCRSPNANRYFQIRTITAGQIQILPISASQTLVVTSGKGTIRGRQRNISVLIVKPGCSGI